MIEKYHIFNKDVYTGDLIHDTNGDKYEYIQKDFGEDGEYVNYKLNADLSPARLRETLYDDRIFPENRVNARELLRHIGLLEYNQWEIFKISRLISDDTIWMSDKMEPEWFWSHHPFASFMPNYTEKTGKPMYSIVDEEAMDDFY